MLLSGYKQDMLNIGFSAWVATIVGKLLCVDSNGYGRGYCAWMATLKQRLLCVESNAKAEVIMRGEQR